MKKIQNQKSPSNFLTPSHLVLKFFNNRLDFYVLKKNEEENKQFFLKLRF
jgi:hypothetical protein